VTAVHCPSPTSIGPWCRSSPFALCQGLFQEGVEHTREVTNGIAKGNHKGKPPPVSYSSSFSFRTRSAHSDGPLCEPSSCDWYWLLCGRGGAEPKIAYLAAPFIAEEVTELEAILALPASLRISAHWIFCWAFQLGQHLKKCPRVCDWYGQRSQ